MKTIFTAFTAIVSLAAIAQTAPPIQGQKCLGGSRPDYAYSIQQTSDGGYIVAGYSQSNNGDVSGHHGTNRYSDYWIVKFTKNGDIKWQKSLGGSGDDLATSIQQTSDGGYIVAGWSASNDGDVSGNHGIADYWIVKLTKDGDIEWQKSLGGSGNDWANSIQQTTDNGYIVAGQSYSDDGDVSGHHTRDFSDYWIVKLTKNGGIEWQESLGGSEYEGASSIQQTSDGGYIVAGYSDSNDGDVSGNHGSDDYWIVKLTKNGDIEWQKSLGGTYYDEASSIRQTSDSGYIVAGRSASNDGDVSGHHGGVNPDYWIVKLTKNGGIEWQKSLGGSSYDEASSIRQTSDSGYIVAGRSVSNDGDVSGHHGVFYPDYWIVKLAKNGAIQWAKSLGGTSDDYANSIQQTSDGRYIAAGSSQSNDGDVSGNHGHADYWIVKLRKDGSLPEPVTNLYADSQNKNAAQVKQHGFTVYPNPVKDILYLQTKGSTVFYFINSYGKILFTKTISSNGSINISALPPGSYYLRNNATGEVQKLIVER